MRLRYTTEALAHLEAINDFLFERNPVAARRIAADIQTSALRLSEFPFIGQRSDPPGTRQWMMRNSPYLMIHEGDEARDEIVILGVFHGAQDWQSELK